VWCHLACFVFNVFTFVWTTPWSGSTIPDSTSKPEIISFLENIQNEKARLRISKYENFTVTLHAPEIRGLGDLRYHQNNLKVISKVFCYQRGPVRDIGPLSPQFLRRSCFQLSLRHWPLFKMKVSMILPHLVILCSFLFEWINVIKFVNHISH